MLRLIQAEFLKLRRKKFIVLMLLSALFMPLLAVFYFRSADKTVIEPLHAYSARTAHPFQRNGAPFRFKLSKAQQVD